MYKILEIWNRLLQVFIMLKVGKIMVQDSGLLIWVQSLFQASRSWAQEFKA